MSIGKEKFKESISALMDNEASEFEFRHFLKECEGNQDLKSKWERFHLLSAAIRGEFNSSLNGDFPVIKEKFGRSALKSPDLLCRINAELDGLDERANPSSLFNKIDGEISAGLDQKSNFQYLGQGVIAASVAAIVLIVGGALNSKMPQETELQLAVQSDISGGMVPDFDDTYSPSVFSRLPQLNTELTGTELLDEAARVRLRQAVFQEFVGEPQEFLELPVNFNAIIDEE